MSEIVRRGREEKGLKRVSEIVRSEGGERSYGGKV